MNDTEYFDFVHEKDLEEHIIPYNRKGFLVLYGKRDLSKNYSTKKIFLFEDLEKHTKENIIRVVDREGEYIGEKEVIIVPGVFELLKYKREKGNEISTIKRPAFDDERKDLSKLIIEKLKIENIDNVYISWDINKGLYDLLSLYN